MARLSYQERKKLLSSEFVFPKERKYPIPDAAHARDALARASADGSLYVQEKVRRAVKAKFPTIDVEAKPHPHKK